VRCCILPSLATGREQRPEGGANVPAVCRAASRPANEVLNSARFLGQISWQLIMPLLLVLPDLRAFDSASNAQDRQVVADYRRLSAALAAGRPGHGERDGGKILD
jgi:hypothetical protein